MASDTHYGNREPVIKCPLQFRAVVGLLSRDQSHKEILYFPHKLISFTGHSSDLFVSGQKGEPVAENPLIECKSPTENSCLDNSFLSILQKMGEPEIILN